MRIIFLKKKMIPVRRVQDIVVIQKERVYSSSLFRFAHEHSVALGSFVSVLIFCILFAMVKPTSASIAVFHPTSCLGGWEHPENVTGDATLGADAKPEEYSTGNSARNTGTPQALYCGGWQGKIPDNTKPKLFTLSLHWSVDDGTVVHVEPKSFVNPTVPADLTPTPQLIQVEDSSTPTATPVPDASSTATPDTTPAPATGELQSFLYRILGTLVLAQDATIDTVTDTPAVPVAVTPQANPFMELEYTLDGTTWTTLTTVDHGAWQNASYTIPLAGWETLDHFQVALKPITTFDTPPTVYLDSMAMSVSYDDIGDVLVPPTVKLDDAHDGISGKSNFTSDERVEFTITNPNLDLNQIKTLVNEGNAQVVDDRNGLLGKKVDREDEYTLLDTFTVLEKSFSSPVSPVLFTAPTIPVPTIEAIPVLDPSVDSSVPSTEKSVSLLQRIVSPQKVFAEDTVVSAVVKTFYGEDTTIAAHVVTVLENGQEIQRIQIDKPDRSFKPGKYKLEVTFTTPQAIFVSEQDFNWGVLSINTNKSVYASGEYAYLQMGVLDDGGHTLCNAGLDLTIATPSGSTQNFSTSNNSIIREPQCGPDNVISVPDYYTHYTIPSETGTYTMTLTAHTANGDKTITDTFTVSSDISYVIDRTGPTRIYPVATYPMTLRVTSATNWQGVVTERVPASFTITQPLHSAEYISIVTEGDTKILSWHVSLSAGQETVLGYQFLAPPISPEFYLLGESSLVDTSGAVAFTEARNWQIASDAACNATGTGTWGGTDTANFTSCTGAASTGTGTGNRPGAADALTINAGVAVTLSTTSTISSLVLTGGATAASVTLSGANLTVSGTTTINAPTAAVTNLIAVGTNTFSSGGISIVGSATGGRVSSLTASTGTITTSAGITFSGTAAQAQLTTTGAGTINLVGTISAGGTMAINAGTTLSATGTSAINGAYTFGILSVPSGTLTLGNVAMTFAGTSSITGTLTNATGATLKTFTGLVTVNSGGSFLMNVGTSPAKSFGGGIAMNGTSFNSGTGATTLTATQSFSGTSAMTIGAAISIPTGTTLTISNTNTVTFSSTITMPIGSPNLVVATGATVVSGTLTFTANSTAGGAQLVTLQGTGNFSPSAITMPSNTSTGTAKITAASGATGTLTVSGTTTISGSATASGGLSSIDFGTVATAANFTTNALTMAGGTVGMAKVIMATGTLTANGLITLTGSTVEASITTTTGTIIANAGITFAGTLAQSKLTTGAAAITLTGTMSGAGTLSIAIATFNTTGTATIGAAYTLPNLNVLAGTTTLGAFAITISGATSVTGTLTNASSATLKTFTGLVTVNSGGSFNLNVVTAPAVSFAGGVTVSSGATAFTATGATTFTATQTLGGAVSMTFGAATINSGAVVTNSNTATVTFSTLTIASATVANGMSLTTGSTTATTTTLAYTANAGTTSQTITMNGTANFNVGTTMTIPAPTSTGSSLVTCAGGATGTFATTGALSITGNSTSTGAVTLGMATCTLSVGGLLTITGGTNATGAASVTSTTGTLTASAGMTLAGTAAQARLTTTGAGTINLVGTISAGGTLAINAGTTLSSTGTSAINGAYTFGNLSVPSGTLSLGGVAITFAGTTSVTGGSIASTSATGLKTFTGAVTVTTGSFNLSAFATATSFAGGITMNGTTFNSGTGATTFTATQALAGSSAMTFGGATTINNTFTLTNNNTSTVTFSSNLLGGGASANFATGLNSTTNVAGTVMTTGTLTPTTSAHTIAYTGGAQTVKIPTTNPYYNLTISAAGVKSLAAATTVSNTTTISAGTLDTVSGSNWALNTGDLTIGASGTLLGQAATITLTGSWSNTGTFTPATSTVLLNGGNTVTVSGTTTFTNLTITHTTAKEVDFQSSGAPVFHVTGVFTVTGHTGNLITLHSTVSGSQWQFHPTGTTSVAFVSTKDSACQAGSVLVNPTNYVNEGDNGQCWFPASISFAISDNTIGFGSLVASAATFATGNLLGSGSEVEANNFTASSNAAGGYVIKITGNTLTSGANTITALGAVNTASIPGTKQFGLRITATGGSGSVSSPYSAAGFALDTAGFPSTIATSTVGDGATTTYSCRYLANISNTTPAGAYTSNLTYIMTGTF